MIAYEVLLEENAPAEEVQAVRDLFGEIGLAVDVRAAYGRKSAGDLPWLILNNLPLSALLAAFTAAYGAQVGKHAGDATKEAAHHLAGWVRRLYVSRAGEGQVVLHDDEQNLDVLLDRDMTEEAAEALFEVDPATGGGDAGQVRWDPTRRWHPPF